jgi:hypothetical protein
LIYALLQDNDEFDCEQSVDEEAILVPQFSTSCAKCMRSPSIPNMEGLPPKEDMLREPQSVASHNSSIEWPCKRFIYALVYTAPIFAGNILSLPSISRPGMAKDFLEG